MAGEEKQIVVEETTVVPGKMEFRLISPTESNFLKHIEWNKEELLAAVRSKVALYEGIVYTEETVKTAKNDRAELNNLVKAIDERRKKVKEVINQPYAEFEKELKEITDLIKKQSAEIDEQVKAFETAEKEEKRAKIMEAYEKAVDCKGEGDGSNHKIHRYAERRGVQLHGDGRLAAYSDDRRYFWCNEFGGGFWRRPGNHQ